jgi:hypothetical protein
MAEERGPWEDYQSARPASSSSSSTRAPWEDYGGLAESAEEPSALSRFFTSLGQMVNVPGMLQEYMHRPDQWKAVSDVLGTKRGSPEEAAAVERGMNVPLSNPLAYTPPAGVVGQVAEPAALAYTQAKEGNLAGAAGTLTGGYVAAPLMTAGIAKGTQLAGRGLGAAGTAIVEGPGKALATREGRTAVMRAQGPAETMQVIMRGPDQPVKLMTQALKPRAANTRWTQATDTAMKEIGKSSDELGPITDIDSLHAALTDAKKRVWSQREAIAGPQAQRGISLEPVADAIERSISKRTAMMDPAKAQAVSDVAAKYRGRTFTIQEAEELLKGANAELDAYYAKNPAAQRAKIDSNPDTAALVAEGKALRNRVYGTLDAEGQGAAPRELSRRYGALLNLEEEVYRRKNVADRQSEVGLAEQTSFARAAGKTAKGMFRMKGGDVLGGGADIAEAWASRQLAKDMAEANKTNALIERAFRNYKDRPLTVGHTPFQPKALLGQGPLMTEPPPDPSGIVRNAPPPQAPAYDPRWVPPRPLLPAPGGPPIVTPPPMDPSGIRVVPGEPYLPPGNRTLEAPRPRTLGELAAPPVITPPPVDPSGIQILDAAAGIAIDPKTGRIFRYFTSEGQ